MLIRPCALATDIHRIYVDHNTLLDDENILAASTEDSSLHRQSFMHPCRSAPHIPSINVDSVTLVERIRQSRWSSLWRCRVDDEEKLCTMKFASEVHSIMVLHELYMYEVILKGSCLVPVYHGVFQRPAGGWFGILLEGVGNNLEKIYGPEWSDIKRGITAMQWKKLIKSVKKSHSLGVQHGDFEPRNVTQTTEDFKFFDFGRSRLHRCQQDECGSWKICWMCIFLENNNRAKINVRSGNTGKLF